VRGELIFAAMILRQVREMQFSASAFPI